MADPMAEPMGCGDVSELASGFVLGALEPAEAERVREHLRTCPEAHREFAELGAAVPALARSVPVASPSPDLGARILRAARAEAAAAADVAAVERAEVAAARPAVVVPSTRGLERPVAREAASRRTNPFAFLSGLGRPAWGVAALAAVLAIVLGAWNLQLQSQVSDLAAYRAGVAAVLDAASASGAQVAVVTSGSASGPAGLAAVDPSGRLVIAMHDLDRTAGSEVYEAWLIGADGTPRPAGSFQVGGAGVGTLTSAVSSSESGVVVALTREPRPGATTPTLPIVAKGSSRPANG